MLGYISRLSLARFSWLGSAEMTGKLSLLGGNNTIDGWKEVDKKVRTAT